MLIQKGNKQLRVDDVRGAAMIATAGYVQIDEKTGKPIHVEDADKDLKKENAALKKKVKELEAQVAELTKKPE